MAIKMAAHMITPEARFLKQNKTKHKTQNTARAHELKAWPAAAEPSSQPSSAPNILLTVYVVDFLFFLIDLFDCEVGGGGEFRGDPDELSTLW